jgi:hypothetical protein
MDPDVGLALATGLFALGYLALAVRSFRHGRNGVAAARLFAALLFGGVAFYLAVFQLRMF